MTTRKKAAAGPGPSAATAAAAAAADVRKYLSNYNGAWQIGRPTTSVSWRHRCVGAGTQIHSGVTRRGLTPSRGDTLILWWKYFCGWILQRAVEKGSLEGEEMVTGDDDDDEKRSSLFKEKIGWHNQLPHWVTATLVTALQIHKFPYNKQRFELLSSRNNSAPAITVGVGGVQTPQKIQVGVSDTPKMLVYLVTCNWSSSSMNFFNSSCYHSTEAYFHRAAWNADAV